MRRTNTEVGGGRYDKVIGELIQGYQYGFPYLMAIDTSWYANDGRIQDTGNPGEIQIAGPNANKDIVMLFDLEHDHLKEIEEITNTIVYSQLVERRRQAIQEERRIITI